jgi:hypothetical protein
LAGLSLGARWPEVVTPSLARATIQYDDDLRRI